MPIGVFDHFIDQALPFRIGITGIDQFIRCPDPANNFGQPFGVSVQRHGADWPVQRHIGQLPFVVALVAFFRIDQAQQVAGQPCDFVALRQNKQTILQAAAQRVTDGGGDFPLLGNIELHWVSPKVMKGRTMPRTPVSGTAP